MRKVWLLVGPLGGMIVGSTLIVAGVRLHMAKTLGVCVLMIIWWIGGPIPVGATALLPVSLFPLLGILSGEKVCTQYFGDSIMVLIGSLLVAAAIEEYKLHGRFAHFILRQTIAYGQKGILFGFILCTGMLSMWLSNSAAAALMIPLARAVYDESTTQAITTRYPKNFRVALDLGVAYAASLGGTATLTGTGTNIVLVGTLASAFGRQDMISFAQWFILTAPLAILNLILLWLLLVVCFLRTNDGIEMNEEISRSPRPEDVSSWTSVFTQPFWSAVVRQRSQYLLANEGMDEQCSGDSHPQMYDEGGSSNDTDWRADVLPPSQSSADVAVSGTEKPETNREDIEKAAAAPYSSSSILSSFSIRLPKAHPAFLTDLIRNRSTYLTAGQSAMTLTADATSTPMHAQPLTNALSDVCDDENESKGEALPVNQNTHIQSCPEINDAEIVGEDAGALSFPQLCVVRYDMLQ